MGAGLNQYRLVDGVKSIPLNQLPEEAWRTVAGESGNTDGVQKLVDAVGVLSACVDVRAAALSSLPWHIYRGETRVWSWEEEETPDELLFLDTLPDLLYRTEAALCIGPDAHAFWGKSKRVQMEDVHWLTPSTMTPVWDKDKGLLGFERRIGDERIRLKKDEVLYFVRPGLHETKPAKAPASVAMTRAKVSYNADQFASMFFERGAIKTTLLTVDPTMPQVEREKLKSWWRRFMSGIKNAWDAGVVNAETVKPVVVGEGLSELANTELDTGTAKAIATTMRVPHSLLFSDAANYATSQQDEMNFYTLTIGPDARLIARTLNRGLLNPLGYSLRFDMNALALFQEDENERASALKTYVDSGMPLALAAEMLGLDLPEGWTFEQLAQIEEEQRQREAEQQQAQIERLRQQGQPGQPGQNGQPPNGARQAEVRRFRAWAKKRTNPDPAKFASDILSDEEKSELLEDGDAGDAPFPATDSWDNYP